MGKAICIANQKGGVGKTTTAVNLSAALALADKRCLLLDFDPQSNATSGVGLERERIIHTVYHAVVNGIPLRDLVVKSGYDNLDLIPSNRDLTGAEIELMEREKREFILRDRLHDIADNYDYIFIDSPPSLGLLTVNALTAADTVLLPIQCEYYALEGLTQLLSTIELVRKNLNPKLDIEGIVLTMYDSRTNLSKQVAAEVKKYFSDLVYTAVIPRSVRLSEAPGFGKPIIHYDMRSQGADSYLSLAQEVIKRNNG